MGSVRIASKNTEAYGYSVAFAPFGEQYSLGGTTPAIMWFGENPTNTVNDEYDADNRKLHASQGRWISPDPAGLAAADLSNPQRWNRYAYVGSNPLSFTDPIGLCLQTKGGDTCDGFFGFDDFDLLGLDLCPVYKDFGCWDNPFAGIGREKIFEGDNEFRWPAPPLMQTVWSDLLGLPTGLSCPQIGGASDILCRGISPIMGEKPDKLPSCDKAGPNEPCYSGVTQEDKKALAGPITWYLCAKSPPENVVDYGFEGMLKGAGTGLYTGWELGEFVIIPVVADASVGLMGGTITGFGASKICEWAGAYSHH